MPNAFLPHPTPDWRPIANGGMKPHRSMELPPGTSLPVEGLLFIGENGKLLSGYYGGNNQLPPEKRSRDFKAPEKTLTRTIGHYKEWVQAAKTGRPTNMNFEFGGRMTEVAQLGAMAARCGRPLLWDAAQVKVTNDAEANGWVNPPTAKDGHSDAPFGRRFSVCRWSARMATAAGQ